MMMNDSEMNLMMNDSEKKNEGERGVSEKISSNEEEHVVVAGYTLLTGGNKTLLSDEDVDFYKSLDASNQKYDDAHKQKQDQHHPPVEIYGNMDDLAAMRRFVISKRSNLPKSYC
ncbi:hypothetical protein AgCh_026748 [Apium graveolens]